MGEPAAAKSAAARDERDVLLATKLNVPGLRPDLVPAGYGKTVLLPEWVWPWPGCGPAGS